MSENRWKNGIESWLIVPSYLQFVKSLKFQQTFVRTETILALCDLHIGAEYPNIVPSRATQAVRTKGLLTSSC